MALVLAVYASCLHLCKLCKTRFRLMVSLFRIGLVTYRVSATGFKERYFIPLSWTLLGAKILGLILCEIPQI